MFSDADLLGVPLRVVVSPRNLADGVFELSSRDKSLSEKIPPEKAVERITGLIKQMLETPDIPQK